MVKNIYVLALLSLLLGCDQGANNREENESNSLELIVGEHRLELKSENADLETELRCPTVDALLVIEREDVEPVVVSMKGLAEYGAGSLSYFFSSLEDDGNITNFSSVSQITDGETDVVKTSFFSSNEFDFDFDFQDQDVVFDPNILGTVADAPPVLKMEGNIFEGGTWVREGGGLVCSGYWKLEI